MHRLHLHGALPLDYSGASGIPFHHCHGPRSFLTSAHLLLSMHQDQVHNLAQCFPWHNRDLEAGISVSSIAAILDSNVP